jgi:fatty acid desaturase
MSAPRTYAELKAALHEAGCFDYAPRRAVAALGVSLATSGGLFVLSSRLPLWAAAPVFALASVLFYRIGFLMHDAAHGGFAASPEANRRFADLTSGVLGEFVSGWRHGHDRHHGFPNVRTRDGDQSERWDPTLRYRHRTAAAAGLFLLSRYKGLTVPKSMALLGLRDGFYCRAYRPERLRRELLGSLLGLSMQVAVAVALWGGWGVLAVLIHWHIGLVYLNAVFAGNHYDLLAPTEAEAKAMGFLALQARTTRNYAPGPVVHFFCGGLEYQLEHHLFPTLPRHQLARASAWVRACCEANGLPYEVLPFMACMGRVVDFHMESPRAESAPRAA